MTIAPPPAIADGAGGPTAWTYALFPVLGSVGMLVFALVRANPLFLIAGAVFVLGSLGMGLVMFITTRGRSAAQRFESRDRYLAHLADAREQLSAAADRQRERAAAAHPHPGALGALVGEGSRTWQRRPGDGDFLHLRLGTGTVPAAAAPAAHDQGPTAAPDPAAQAAATALIEASATLEAVPVALALRAGTTTVVGEVDDVRALARAMVAQLAALHAPDDVRLAIATPAGPGAGAAWEHAKWLPHTHHPSPGEDQSGEALLIAPSAAEVSVVLGAELERRRASVTQRGTALTSAAAAGPALVILVDGPLSEAEAAGLGDAAQIGVAVVHLVHGHDVEGPDVVVSIRLTPGAGPASTPMVQVVDRAPDAGRPGEAGAALGTQVTADSLDVPAADALARALAPLRLSREVGEVSLTEVSDLPALLGIADVGAIDARTTWRTRPVRELLRVPLGVDEQGRAVHLDLKEAALEGMGPHGLIVGATGSGKSELLRTLVLALAITHGPDELAMVLVDFKGGATFAGLSTLPHLAGSVTDLEDDPDTVARFAAAVRGELRRREVLLADAGLSSTREHRAARLAGSALPAMPHLLIVVDEFSELLVQQPDLIDLFVTVGRLGRSLGVHLLLATQRLEEGRLRGLESHLSYRIALRTFSAAESRAVIATPDAYELPPVPGSAYLKAGTTDLRRMRVATVSAPYAPPTARVGRAAAPSEDPVAFTTARTAPDALPSLGLDLSDPTQRSTLSVATAALEGAAPTVAPVWLAPLPARVALHDLLGPLRRVARRGLVVDGPGAALRVPLGISDHPETQSQRVFTVDLAAAGGHVGIVGAPGTGKSTTAATLITSLAITHTPAQVQVYALDLGGGSLAPLATLPHVAAVAPRSRPELMRRTVAHVTAMIDARETWFHRDGVESMAALRATRHPDAPTDHDAQHGAGPVAPPGDLGGDVILLVDGWATLRAELEDLESAITALAVRGAAYGLHLVVASPRWVDLRPALKDAIGTRLEARLGDGGDSVFTRAVARTMPTTPGRILTAGDVRVQVATPHVLLSPVTGEVDGPPAPATAAALGAALGAAWSGPVAAPVRLLPTVVPHAQIAARGVEGPGVSLGLREADLGPAPIDLLGEDPHLLVVGEPRSGRTTTLATLIAAMTSRYTPDQLRVVVVDYRRALLDTVPQAHLSTYCASAPVAIAALATLAEKLTARLPGADVTHEQLRAGTWWSGPRALVVVDDHDLVSATGADPLAELAPLLPLARDVGLHVVVARTAGGITTATMTNPVLRRLREIATPALLHSGPADEGPVAHGTRMRSLPPGRALHTSRAHPPTLVQVATTDPEHGRAQPGEESPRTGAT